MAISEYVKLKEHFDKIMGSEFAHNTGLEKIRGTYERSFSTPIHLFDVYETPLRDPNNPIKRIVTLVGDSEKEIPEGIIMSYGDIVHVNIFDNDVFRLDSDDLWYIDKVYKAMNNIVDMDIFNKSDRLAINNPYMTYVKCCPLYFTYHHIREYVPHMIPKSEEMFKGLIEKYIAVWENVDMIYDSLINNPYSTDPEVIYNIISAQNKAKLFTFFLS